jgi:hypothetical protein
VHSTLRTTNRILILVWACAFVHGSALAGEPWEFWPELQGFFGLSPQTRIFLNVPYARGKESEYGILELAAYLDISLKPIVGRYIEKEDWQRSRYAWVRIGYDHVVHYTDGVHSSTEERGIVSTLHKIGLPDEIWLEARERADLRWMGGEYSTRYRLRLEATREFTVFGHSVVPYLNAEGFYDTRYVGLARMLYMAGSEFTFTDHFRCELYLAQQTDYRPNPSGLAAFGVVAKWYY